MQQRIIQKDKLLNEKGELKHIGWATDLILEYNRESIRASKIRIKEWDYYCILKDEYGVAFTIADNAYLGFVAVTVFDFTKPEEITQSVMVPFPMGKFNMPRTSKHGNVSFENSQIKLNFIRKHEERLIEVEWQNFHKKKALKGTITLYQPDDLETMVITIPFPKNKHAFYYNQKINCMPAQGLLTLGDKKLEFSPNNSFGVLDWGRGVWTYSNVWYWGSASGKIDGKLLGFNIGYGFGDNSRATENIIFFDGKAHKLEQVFFHIPKDSFLKPWKFTSNDGRFEMDFFPILDRNSNTNLLLLKSVQHQVFGKFSGKVVLNDGQVIYVKNLLGFAEKVVNKW